jgi:ABC-type phosphate transport system ATPase subunit
MFFYDGVLVEHGATTQIFEHPQKADTQRYVSGRIG